MRLTTKGRFAVTAMIDLALRMQSGPVTLAAMRIRDQPRFAWRGLMVDSARHYQSIATLKATLDAMAEMERLAGQLPQGFGFEWTGQSREEKLAGAQALIVYAFAILAVFLCLAALYESWSIPFAVILVVPLGVVGVLMATLLRGYANDVYFQVGLITIIGLTAKNAILIVEFARELEFEGRTPVEAAIEASRLRLRPIVMTSAPSSWNTCGAIW